MPTKPSTAPTNGTVDGAPVAEEARPEEATSDEARPDEATSDEAATTEAEGEPELVSEKPGEEEQVETPTRTAATVIDDAGSGGSSGEETGKDGDDEPSDADGNEKIYDDETACDTACLMDLLTHKWSDMGQPKKR